MNRTSNSWAATLFLVLERLRTVMKTQYALIFEWVFLVVVWYLLIGRIWNGVQIPTGGEYARSMSGFFFWDSLKTCVNCSFWMPHGGGRPVLADPFGSFLHPMSMLLSLLFGAVAGASYTLSFAFLLLGASALWLGQILGLHQLVRGWFALAVMIGGHVVCRLELGSIGMPLSLASLFAAYVCILWYLRSPTLLRALAVGVAVGALCLSGQLYYQYFFVLSIAIVWIVGQWQFASLLKRIPMIHTTLMLGIAMLMASPIVLNLFMTAGIYEKEGSLDLQFTIPIHIQLLNFLIPTTEVAKTQLLNPFPYVWVYATYIGWIPCIAATMLYSRIISFHRYVARVTFGFTALAIVIVTGVFSEIALSFENQTLSTIVGGFRFITIYNGVAGIGILLLAALGMHGYVCGSSSPRNALEQFIEWSGTVSRLNVRVLSLAAVLVYSLIGMHSFAEGFLRFQKPFDAAAETMISDSTRLVDGYIEMPDWMFLRAMEKDVRSASYVSSVKLSNRTFPPPKYIFTQKIPETIPTTLLAEYRDEWKLLQNNAPEAQYAVLQRAVGPDVPCNSTARNGVISVTCASEEPGTVRLLVHALPGWEYALEGQSYQSVSGRDWLTAPFPIGQHTITFRYGPWYAWAGLIMLAVPWLLIFSLCVIHYRRTAASV
jgi:hypothetical protein